jgi:KDO2-lipid IV(A) lauroyltransferase
MASRFTALLLSGFLRLIGFLPFLALKGLSRLIFFFLYYFPGYRKETVWLNLLYTLNDMKGKDLEKIRKQFYLHFSELILEVIKGLFISQAKMDNRVTLTPESRELLNHYHQNGRNIVMLMGHFGNWEWASMMAKVYCPLPYFSFYAPLSNPFADRYITEKRTRWGARFLTPKEFLPGLEAMQSQQCQVGLVADQSPTGRKNVYTTRFLGMDTNFFTGPERISRALDAAVIHVRLIKNGFARYTIQMELITDHMADLQENELTEMYARHLEKDILQHPEWWIWSHRRWKGQIPY